MGGDLIMQLAGLGVRPLTKLLMNRSDAPLADLLAPEGSQNALRAQAGRAASAHAQGAGEFLIKWVCSRLTHAPRPL